ncbi:tetratricopeptide repeat protein [uncultured Alsobacter sp.]|uniref:tetratricopeptide repeat protein n=1 Tax=uncultured Alsobacter sp. TaxID=1748258 RepID=UPI0025CDCDCE|nr:tetratricopeptide repeat protein [uncultured Alsobacter sp.]
MTTRTDLVLPSVKRIVPPARFDDVFALVIDLPHRSPGRGLPRRLDALFRELAQASPQRSPDEIEDLIWAHWIANKDQGAASAMAIAVDAMAAGALDLAEPILDELVETHPDWAEAWNKRGTMHFVEKRDAQAIHDIERALLIEPRHFGAVSGFAQICLRHGRLAEARASFQVALSINPHLEGLREAITEIGLADRGLLH